MSGSQPGHRLGRQRSPNQMDDEDADFQYALKLSAELNGDLGGHAEAAAAAAKRQAESKIGYDFAVQTQFKGAGNPQDSMIQSLYAQGLSRTSGLLSQGVATASVTIVDTEGAVTQTFRTLPDFQDYLKASVCATCGERFFKSDSDVSTRFSDWFERKSALSSLLECKSCGESSCIMCPSTKSSRRSLAIFENKSASWCCTNGRLLLIWVLLCGFDISYCKDKVDGAKEAGTAKLKPQPASAAADEPKGKATAKGKGKAKAGQPSHRSGIGYGGSDGYLSSMDVDELDDYDLGTFGDSGVLPFPNMLKKSRFSAKGAGRTISDDKSKAFTAQQALDSLATTILGLLEHLLPSLDRGHKFDMKPPAIVTDMLLESRLLSYCADLLRNDFLDDALSRKKTYDAVLDLVRILGTHYTTAHPTIFSKRPRQPELFTLFTRIWHPIEPASQETVPSIADSVHELSTLSNLLLKNAEHYKTMYDTKNDKDLLSLCRKISDLWKLFSLSMNASSPDAESSKCGQQSPPPGEVANVSDVTDEQICASHVLANRAQAQCRSAPGRLKRLVSEINILKTSLPPNIFVRHGESRLDMMKCAIVGPEGTPYENGLFEFDIYCPSTYPNSPPEVSFKGTGGGVHGINPNLYADGKVCLSLLGTWSGEPWKPGESTLLQVLVSLQAMVFCEQPWYNEPGRECGYGSGRSNGASEAYNRKLRELTVRLAMLDWLEKIPPIWEGVVEQHFGLNADRILRTVVEWNKQSTPARYAKYPEMPTYADDHHGSEVGYRTTLPRLHEKLQKYGATVALPNFPKEDAEPQSKRARIEGSQYAGSQATKPLQLSEPAPAHFYDNLAGCGFDSLEAGIDDIGVAEGVEEANDAFALAGTQRGGYMGRGFSHAGHSFRGRGHVLGAGPSDAPVSPPAASALSRGSQGGRGRGLGRGVPSWLGRGGPVVNAIDAYPSAHDIKYGKGRTLGDNQVGDKAGIGRGGRGGQGGRGGRGGRGG